MFQNFFRCNIIKIPTKRNNTLNVISFSTYSQTSQSINYVISKFAKVEIRVWRTKNGKHEIYYALKGKSRMVVYLLKGKENQSVSEFLRNVIIQTLVSDSVCERLVSHCFWRFYGKTILFQFSPLCYFSGKQDGSIAMIIQFNFYSIGELMEKRNIIM